MQVLALLDLTPADLAGATPRRGPGCPDCGGTGYRGRTAVYEVLVVDAAMRRVLVRDATEAAVGEAATEQGIEIVTTEQARATAIAAGLTPTEADAVTADYADAQLEALKKAMLAVGLLAFLSLLPTRRLPGRPPDGALPEPAAAS